MALPKHRQSHSKTRLRRSHDALTAPNISVCPDCGEPKQPHRLCGSCGSYNGKKIIQLEEDFE